MSFDATKKQIVTQNTVSIPLEQGNVFRRGSVGNFSVGSDVSIPLEQGNVFRHNNFRRLKL